MSRINTNVQSLIAQHVLGRQTRSLNTSLERLSTGLRINTAKDNPAGLIASENLRAEKAGIAQAIGNAERANNLIGTAEGALNEVSSLLVELQTLVTETASSGGLTSEEIAANQKQVDTILNSIDRIAGNTQFGGKKLLNGSLDYTTSGVATSAFTSVQVNSARLGGTTRTVQVEVTASAETARITRNSAGSGLNGNVSIRVTGNKGSETLSFVDKAKNSAIMAAVNGVTSVTGVSATIVSSALHFDSVGYGSAAFVSVETVDGSFTVSASSDIGKDPTVLVNGESAEASGLNVSLRKASLDLDLVLTSGLATTATTKTFYITAGGADFMIGGQATLSNQASLGISAVATGSLGNSSDGYLSTLATGGSNSLAGGNAVDAQEIIDLAINQVSDLRGRLGAFQKYTLAPTINGLEVALENASSAESAIRDTDFAVETSNLTRSQILSNAATNVLALANSLPQSVLSLLRG